MCVKEQKESTISPMIGCLDIEFGLVMWGRTEKWGVYEQESLIAFCDGDCRIHAFMFK